MFPGFKYKKLGVYSGLFGPDAFLILDLFSVLAVTQNIIPQSIPIALQQQEWLSIKRLPQSILYLMTYLH